MTRKPKLMPTHDKAPQMIGKVYFFRRGWCSVLVDDEPVAAKCDGILAYGDRVRLTFHTAPGRAGWWEATKIEEPSA